jgi:hypothetical protein
MTGRKAGFWLTVVGVVLLTDFAKGLVLQKFPNEGLVKFLTYGSWPAANSAPAEQI